MPKMLTDIFSNDAFSCMELTQSINMIPNNYGRIKELNLFPERGVSTTTVAIELNNGVLNILPPTERGGPASKGKKGKRNIITFQIPQYAHEDIVLPDEVQNVRAFGSENEMESVQDVVLKKLQTMRNKHDITLEYMRAGALQGKVKDDEGNVLLDLFKAFGVNEKVIDFKFGTADSKIQEYCRNVSRHIEENLMGEVMDHVHCLCSSAFFEQFIAHPAVKDAYQAYQNATPYRDDVRSYFKFQNIVFEEYVAKSSTADGKKVLKFIPDGDARFFPVGTVESFSTVNAPADFNETINTIGQPLYAKQRVLDFDRGVEIHTQSNPLPICARPQTLVRGHSSN